MSDKPFSFDVSNYPALPRLRGLFVTGTDTGVGKTLIAGAIASRLKLARRVEVFKPVATGCRGGRGGLMSDDAAFLAAMADSRRTLDEITPLRYKTAVAPNVAAAREHRPIDLEAMLEAYRSLQGKCDCAIVEGVGGLLCPISDDFWVIHFAKLTGLPLVIVARAGLGTINHTLLTLQVARQAGLVVAGVVINRYLLEPSPGANLPAGQAGPKRRLLRGGDADANEELQFRRDEDLAMFTNPQQIAKLGKVDVLAIVPEENANSVEKVTLGPDTAFAISQVDWERLLK